MYGEKELIVKVNKSDLLNILKTNRDKHNSDYQKAKTGFRILLEKELRTKLRACTEGKKVALSFKNQKPVSYLGDYDDVIGMLELATDEVISLNHQQYKQYIKDDWTWKKSWSTSNVAYLSAAL